MPFFLLLLYIGVSYIYPGQIVPALAPYRITYWVGISGLVFSMLWLLVRDRTPLRVPQLWLLIAFTITLGVSQMLAEQWLGAPLSALQRFGPSLTMFVLTICSVDSIRKMRVVSVWIVLLTLIVMLQGAAAYHFGYRTDMFLFDPVMRTEYAGPQNDVEVPASPSNYEFEQPEGDTMVRIRGLGLLHDPNDLALGFIVALALCTGVWTHGAILRNVLLVILPASALGYGVYLTHSRGGLLGVLVTLLRASTVGLGRVKAIALAVIIFAAAAARDFGGGRLLLSTSDASAAGRFTAWTEGLEMLKASPLLGVGFGQFLEHHEMTAHNSFVLCFAEAGLVGYFFWLGFIVLTFVQLQRLKQLPNSTVLDTQVQRWAGTLQLAIIGFMTAAFFLSRTFVPMLYLVMGLSVALVLIARRADRPVWSPSLPMFAGLVLTCEVVSIGLIYLAVKLHLA